ncbi:MAG: glycoside hydrolase family 30 beta sandwich domain-containing protein [Terracidiphilus sp.]
MSRSSRRSFLKTASTTAAAIAASARVSAWAQQGSPGPVRVWSTFRDRRHAAQEPLAFKPASAVAADAILLDPAATKQEILGFGGAFTDATCYVISQLNDSEREAVMHDLFAPGEMAMNVCRTCIGASDYSRTAYTFDESTEPDPELKKFSIDHDREYILPVLKQARQVNPELFLFSSPWTPPGWMKTGGSMLGGSMRKSSYVPYARYFVKFLEGYKAAGVAIDAVTVQNEVDADQDGRMPACLWGQEYEVEFAKWHLGPALRKAGLPAKIWVLDHNYALWGRAIDELSDEEADQFIDGIAWHGYAGEVSAMTRVHDAFPAKNAYWTEGGPFITQRDYQTDWATWAETFNSIVNNWARSITAWNLALDEKGQPNIGPFSCGGTITIENGTHQVTRSGQYWAFAHYSRHVKRGAKVFATDGVGEKAAHGDPMPITHAGFSNPDGSLVVVLANRGHEKRTQLVLGANAVEVDLPADSVHTLQWS